jgi:Protein of unknown function (DUF3618)
MGPGADAMSSPAQPPPEILDPAVAPATYDANRLPADIEEDIARTRADLGETLDALERQLAPRQLLEKGVDMLRDSMDGNFGRIGDTLRGNPIPLALIAGGLGWLLLTRTGGARAIGDMARSHGGAIGDAARRVSDVASGTVDRVTDPVGAGKLGDPTSDNYAYARPKPETGRTDRASDDAGEPVDRARNRLSRLMEEHPLAVGALGFLAGAALAMVVPSKRLGDGTLGETGDRLLDEAKQRGRDAAGHAQCAAGEVEKAAASGTGAAGEVENAAASGTGAASAP